MPCVPAKINPAATTIPSNRAGNRTTRLCNLAFAYSSSVTVAEILRWGGSIFSLIKDKPTVPTYFQKPIQASPRDPASSGGSSTPLMLLTLKHETKKRLTALAQFLKSEPSVDENSA